MDLIDSWNTAVQEAKEAKTEKLAGESNDLIKQINKIGSYEAIINLHSEIQAKVHIEVVKKEEEN